jgi:hypothetical protein
VTAKLGDFSKRLQANFTSGSIWGAPSHLGYAFRVPRSD